VTEIGGKVAFVTGGGGSIGGAIARALAAEGASVAVADIRAETAQATADEISAAGGKAVGVACDVCDRASVASAKEQAADALGRVSLLFSIAGATSWQRLTEMSDDDVDWIFQVNLMGVVNCLRAFVPDMAKAGEGHVLGTASTAGMRPGWLPYHSAYSSSKLGVIGMMFNIRQELADAGIGSTLLIPAGVATKMGENNGTYRPERFGGPGEGRVETPDAIKKIYAEHQRSWRPPEEVAQMVLLAVRENRPVVVTDPYDRKIFQATYVDPIMTAFDEVEAFEKTLSQPGKRLSIDELSRGSGAATR
jgi:NAD(P)-dependent dehydrogenase (short-subunit alcohol dehydrogenase family)